MALLGRFALVVLAYGVAITAASLFLHVLVVPALGFTTDEEQWLALGGLLVSVPFLAALIGYFSFFPAVIAIALSELAGWRGFLFHAFAGAAIAAATGTLFRTSGGSVAMNGFDGARVTGAQPLDSEALLLVVATGMVAGIAYWMLAGRTAGRWRNRAGD
jgi:membrane protease YdiL (CAAX protease family)